MDFAQLGLSDELVRAVAEQGYTQPTPIQTQAIPAVLAGGDLPALAPKILKGDIRGRVVVDVNK